ncbi:hypothetical protein F2Q69_00026255 [Brassica cretica]|uniref:Uncharacterized protein n=1 Tax=Brassica cretica TaxID=69181 RepID=A0A8S9RV17_BRACR|nr:hypothetical protein F2Q69_00026255 [Brassica cretica]
MSSPQWDDALRQDFSVVKKRCGLGGGSKGFRAPVKRGFQRLGTAAWEGGAVGSRRSDAWRTDGQELHTWRASASSTHAFPESIGTGFE